MTSIFRYSGWIFVLLGVMTIGLMGIYVADGQSLADPGGAVWRKLQPHSLAQFQVLIQRTLGLPDLWDDYVVKFLLWPAWQGLSLVAFVELLFGTILLGLSRKRRRAGILHRNHSS